MHSNVRYMLSKFDVTMPSGKGDFGIEINLIHSFINLTHSL